MKGGKMSAGVAFVIIIGFIGVFALDALNLIPNDLGSMPPEEQLGLDDEQPIDDPDNGTNLQGNTTEWEDFVISYNLYNQTQTYIIHAERYYENEQRDRKALTKIEQFDLMALSGWFYSRYGCPFLLKNESRIINVSAGCCYQNRTTYVNYTANISRYQGLFDLGELCEVNQGDIPMDILSVPSPVYYRTSKQDNFELLDATSPPEEKYLKVAWFTDIHVAFYQEGFPHWPQGFLNVQIGTDSKRDVNLVILHPCLVVNCINQPDSLYF